ncbi:MAG: glycosyltransferase family 39 protein [Hyphomicrobiaceae bacterium]|nr:glycosyltransferase family 39 protein [Hyphomicrobiaceae bacterium]
MRHETKPLLPSETGPASSTTRLAPAAGAALVRALFLALVALLAVRLVALYLNGTDLFFDEAQYWFWSTEPAFGYYSKPPLIAWLIGATTALCGDGEMCVRLASPVLHTLTALAIFWLGRALYDASVGVLAALAYATLPGVSVSAGIISTDVPLLAAWAVALAALVELLRTGPAASAATVGQASPGGASSWQPSLALGVALGLGLNAKYAMAWFVMCLAVYLVATPTSRWLLRDSRLWAALAVAALLIAPNIAWNSANAFATFSHTADNAKWGGSLVNPGKAAEFFAAQFGVFGPILFGALLVIGWRATKGRLAEADRLLLCFSVPLIAVILAQAFVSRAHANWAAPAYVAASVLVVATMLRDRAFGWMRASFAVHLAVVALVIAGTTLAGRASPPFGPDPFARTLGWRNVAEVVQMEVERARKAGEPYAAVLTDDRPVTAALLYYLRTSAIPVLAWQAGPYPTDHFQMTRGYAPARGAPLLLVSLGSPNEAVTGRFAAVARLGEHTVAAGPSTSRTVHLVRLSADRQTR